MLNLKLRARQYYASAPHGITGRDRFSGLLPLAQPENLMMASVFAKGVTVIDNAARRPEIVDPD